MGAFKTLNTLINLYPEKDAYPVRFALVVVGLSIT